MTVGPKMMTLIIKGEPELKLEPFDAFDVEDIHEKLPSLKFDFTNTTVSGMETNKLLDLKYFLIFIFSM